MAVSIDLPSFPDHPGLAGVRNSIAPVAARVSDGEFARMCLRRAAAFWADYDALSAAYRRTKSHRTPDQKAKIARFEKAGLDAVDLLNCVAWFENVRLMLQRQAVRS